MPLEALQHRFNFEKKMQNHTKKAVFSYMPFAKMNSAKKYFAPLAWFYGFNLHILHTWARLVAANDFSDAQRVNVP